MQPDRKNEPTQYGSSVGYLEGGDMRLARFLLACAIFYAMGFEGCIAAQTDTVMSKEQFRASITKCAAGKNISVSPDVVTSITDLYADQITRKAFENLPVLLALMPERERVTVFKLYSECISSVLVSEPPTPVTKEIRVCTGEYERSCRPHDVFFYCYSDVKAWAAAQCASSKVVRETTYGGNKCGYSLDRVYCVEPK
jgi:hypothetical protein